MDSDSYIFVDILALITELTIGEELAFFSGVIVRATFFNLCAIREELALGLLFLFICGRLLLL
jgi:hypothetical protein